MHSDDHDRIDELLRRIDDLECRLEDRDRGRHHHDRHSDRHRGGHRDRSGRDERSGWRDNGPDRWPGPPPPPRRGGRGGEGDEKRIVDLVVALVTERVEQIVSREIDRAIVELRAGNDEPT